MLCWFNWKLFLATLVGIGLMTGCYLWQNSYWQSYCQKWHKFLVGSNRQLALAVATGATGAFGTYMAAAIWADADNQWLATGVILQGCTSLITLSVLLWSLSQQKERRGATKIDSLLENLSHSDPLKRLIAIRQITRLLIDPRLDTEVYSQSMEYFRLMLSQPQLPVVRNALLESLEILDNQPLSASTSSQVRIPIQIKRTRKPIRIINH